MKGKFIKRLTAYALTAAMVMSTPLTAFASEFADNFWISHGDPEEDKKEHGDYGTGTVSSTNTDTEVLEFGQDVVGIVIKEGADNKGVTAKGEPSLSSIVWDTSEKKSMELVAEIQFSSDFKPTEEQKTQINRKITWSSSNLNIIRPKAHYDKRQECTVTAYKGGFASMTASIDIDNDGFADYAARVMVMAKKKPTDITLNMPEKLYAGHTYDLNDYVAFGNDDEYDTVEFTVDVSDAKMKKLVAWGKDGSLKLDKKVKNATATITVKCEGLGPKTETVALDEGYPVTKMTMSNTKPTYAIAEDYDTKTVTVKDDEGKDKEETWYYRKKGTEPLSLSVKAKDNQTTTDDIVWSSSDSRIVKVTANKDDNTKAVFIGLSVGKAVVTATATSGKSAKATVTVTADLIKIEGVSIKGDLTYTGKTTPIEIKRIPVENKDKFKVTVGNKDDKKVVKAKAGVIPTITPVADITTRLGYSDGKSVASVTVVSTNKKSKDQTPHTVKTFTVKQSDVTLNDVIGVVNGKAGSVNKAKIPMNSNRVVNFTADFTPVVPESREEASSTISWTSSKETVATVSNGRVSVVGDGSAKITVSSVGKVSGKYKVNKKTFTINSTPKCEEIVLKSNIVTVKEGAKNATIAIKQQLPKKAADDVQWYIYKDGEMLLQSVDAKTAKKKFVYSTGSLKAGDVVTVIARAKSNAEATAKIVVVAK